MSLFGGARRALSGLAQTDQSGRTWADKLSLLGATLQDASTPGSGNLTREQSAQATRRATAASLAARDRLNRGLFGGGQAAPTLDLEGLARGEMGPTNAQPAAPTLSTLREAAPSLIDAAGSGLDIAPYVSLLGQTQPDMQVDTNSGQTYDARNPNLPGRFARPTVVNDRIVDMGDPGNIERDIPKVPEGFRLLYDAQDNPQIVPIEGYLQGRAGVASAVARGTGEGSAPTDLRTIEGPNGPVTASRSTFLGMGPIAGQNPVDRATAEAYGRTAATNRAEAEESRRVAGTAASRMVPTLYSMEQRLPQVIAGLGSGQRRLGNQILGALGNDDAQARVTATETFENEARQIVAQMIKAFGTNPTEGERKYTEQMSGADVSLTPQALEEGARLTRSRAARDIEAAGGTSQGLGTVIEDGSGRRLIFNGFDWVAL